MTTTDDLSPALHLIHNLHLMRISSKSTLQASHSSDVIYHHHFYDSYPDQNRSSNACCHHHRRDHGPVVFVLCSVTTAVEHGRWIPSRSSFHFLGSFPPPSLFSPSFRQPSSSSYSCSFHVFFLVKASITVFAPSRRASWINRSPQQVTATRVSFSATRHPGS